MASEFQTWTDNLQRLNFRNQRIKDDLINLMESSKNINPVFIKLDNQYICKALKNIKNVEDALYIALDLEFQSSIIEKKH